MKNRILATTLAILLCLSLAACSGAPAEESPAPDETAAPSPTPAPSAEPEETQAPPPEDLRISVLLQPKSELRDSEGSLVFLGYYSEPVVTVSRQLDGVLPDQLGPGQPPRQGRRAGG